MWKGVDGLKSSMEKLSDKSTASELSKEDAADAATTQESGWESHVLVSIPRVSISARAYMNSPIARRDSFKFSTRSAFRVCSLFTGDWVEGSNSKAKAMKAGCSSKKLLGSDSQFAGELILETPCGKGSFFNQNGAFTQSTANPGSLMNTLQRASSEMVSSSANRGQDMLFMQDSSEFLGKRSQVKLEFPEISASKRSRCSSGVNPGFQPSRHGLEEEVLDGICINKE